MLGSTRAAEIFGRLGHLQGLCTQPFSGGPRHTRARAPRRRQTSIPHARDEAPHRLTLRPGIRHRCVHTLVPAPFSAAPCCADRPLFFSASDARMPRPALMRVSFLCPFLAASVVAVIARCHSCVEKLCTASDTPPRRPPPPRPLRFFFSFSGRFRHPHRRARPRTREVSCECCAWNSYQRPTHPSQIYELMAPLPFDPRATTSTPLLRPNVHVAIPSRSVPSTTSRHPRRLP